MPNINLKISMPDGNNMTMAVDDLSTGNMLKQKLQFLVKAMPQEQRLSYESDAGKAAIDDMTTLASCGLKDGDTVSVATGDAVEEQAATETATSALRQNIADKEQFSYYYAHANPPDVPPEHRFAYGGEPAMVKRDSTPERMAVPKKRVEKYSWADEGATVKIYIDGDGEPDMIAAAKDGKNGEVKCDFQEESFRLEIVGEKDTWVFHVERTDKKILPDQCKFRVSAGKRISITLKKANADSKWFNLANKKD